MTDRPVHHVAMPIANQTPGLFSTYCPPCGWRGGLWVGYDLALEEAQQHNDLNNKREEPS